MKIAHTFKEGGAYLTPPSCSKGLRWHNNILRWRNNVSRYWSKVKVNVKIKVKWHQIHYLYYLYKLYTESIMSVVSMTSSMIARTINFVFNLWLVSFKEWEINSLLLSHKSLTHFCPRGFGEFWLPNHAASCLMILWSQVWFQNEDQCLL